MDGGTHVQATPWLHFDADPAFQFMQRTAHAQRCGASVRSRTAQTHYEEAARPNMHPFAPPSSVGRAAQRGIA
jgi:hypothetical protein